MKKDLKKLQREESDVYDKEFEEWEREIHSVQEKIQDITNRLEMGNDGEWHILDEDLCKNHEYKDCSTEEYNEFFRIAKLVMVDDEDCAKLSAFLKENDAVKENVVYICKLFMVTHSATISMIQRHIRVGYVKAGRIIEGFEKIGVVVSDGGIFGKKVVYKQLSKLNRILGAE